MDVILDNQEPKEDWAQAYVDFSRNPENVNKTFNDFFDFIGVSEDVRSEFLLASILKKAQDVVDKE